ncbi:uncharacterized protein LOC133823966 [Humulus lupulus]|uniref:uncharacterized protein LOC133823966 n=1 Tax=Humulus lupulus TaxID=3486 RepID=UPI002B4069FA|nr:uncharacterized protein LOC133823966 [Humulus lupulus]
MPQQSRPDNSISKQPPPFPQRFEKQKQDAQFKKFLDVLKQLCINIPLVEALKQMPNYAKKLKDILTGKRRLVEFEKVALTKECSSFLQNKLPPKIKDPGSFTIPCTIGDSYCGMALCDLGASINLMTMFVFKRLGIGGVRPTTVTLQLADRSISHPDGKIEDVLVRVDKFIVPVDFIVLDYEADIEVPIILGRPFLATGRTLIDVEKRELTMRAQDEQVTFKVFNPIRSPDELGECLVIHVMDSNMEEEIPTNYNKILKMKLPPEKIKKDNEPWRTVKKASSHMQEPHRKKKKKHGRKAHPQMFEVGQRVFFSNPQMKGFSKHLKSSFSDSYSVIKVYPCGALDLHDENLGIKFKVNGKEYKFGGNEVKQHKTSTTSLNL